jgi:N-acetylornithine carbamoyltransferase
MLFYNTSLRTRNSFEAGMTQLGGHAHFLQPGAVYTPALPGEEKAYSTERIADVARVLAEMGHGIAIRIYGKPTGWLYGKGNLIVREFARWSRIPVINMEDDKYHPCQALADVMTMMEKLGDLKGKKFVMSWAYSGSVEKPLAVPQSAIIGASYFGMDITLAHPKGLDLDPEVLSAVEKNAKRYGGSFQIVHDMDEAFVDADVVYPKSWTVQPTDGKTPMDPEKAKAIFEANKHWITTKEKMELTNDALYMHCLPADRGMEVTDEVIDGPNSVIIEEAANRLHAQKGLLALLL